MNEKIDLKVPINKLKRQFDQLVTSNLAKGNELTSKQLLSYVQSIYSQLAILQQIITMDDLNNDTKNENLTIDELPANKYTDDICINLNFAFNESTALYDLENKKEILSTIANIRNYLEEVTIDLDLLELDINPNNFRKIKRKSKTKI